ncbi:oxygenase MpaB family protein [Nocardia sp. CDC160]|uniref:oxygenase MpaB family protein n=1 Tax=Nocardia sp. CDC160 TaxID=3112166 RepID=UPI002DB6F7E4|nr:oxygenase MpaB family protein [Nocardia sp. CDC160]MEC3920109.1 oxygenase MpaB family protein [Nocardia sp. CDC160]
MTAATIPFDATRSERIDRARAYVPDDAVDRVVRGMFRTDTVIDTVVEDFATLGRGTGWRLLARALRDRDPSPPGAPDSLRELLTPLMNPPKWFDPDQVRRGAQLWWRFAPAVIIGLGGTLMTAYAFGDLNKPQALNSRSETMAARRYEETSRWVLSATDPGTLTPGGTGFDATIRIRFVHAMVRRHLRTSGEWQRPAWGDPIHTTGMAVTANGFLLMPLAMFDLFDMPLTGDEIDAVRQLWCWIGHLMGVPEELLAHSVEDAGNITRAATLVFAPPDADTETLTRALLRTGLHPERLLPQPLQRLTAPVLRPAISTLVWGGTGRIVTAYSDPDGTPPRNHPLILTLRQLARAREFLRRTGRLGSDQHIAETQRRVLSAALDAMKAAAAPVDPRDAVTPRS